MIIVPEVLVFKGRQNSSYHGVVSSKNRIFDKAIVKFESVEVERLYKDAITELLKGDNVARVLSENPRSRNGPGSLCVEIRIRVDQALAKRNREFYQVDCFDTNQIVIVGATSLACFWGFQTVRQILHQLKRTFDEPLHLEDMPSFKTRGVLIDVSRDRVPKIEKLKDLIVLLSSVKINQLQLYTEHTFAYKGHEKVWKGTSAYTAADIREIDQYCAKFGITLVPNQNCLGHMSKWLVHEPYRSFAEVPEGVAHPFSPEVEPFTLCPTDPNSFDLCSSLLSELVPNFQTNMSSDQPLVNVNLDEPFDLGTRKGRSTMNKTKAFSSYAHKLSDFARDELDCRMMMWADFVSKKTLPLLPKDPILIEWGYEAGHNWEKRLKLLSSRGHEIFVAPGTSSWGSIGGRTGNAIQNLKEAAYYGKKHGATGYLITDWGDYGHHQQPVVSYIGAVVGAVSAWRVPADVSPKQAKPTEEDICEWMDLLGVFQTTRLTHAAYRLGNAYTFLPQVPNISLLWYVLVVAEPLTENHVLRFACEHFTYVPYPKTLLKVLGPMLSFLFKRVLVKRKRLLNMKAYITEIITSLLEPEDQSLSETRQLMFTARLMLFCCDVWLSRLRVGVHKPATACVFDSRDISFIKQQYRDLWDEFSRPGGLEDSVYKLNRMVGDKVGSIRALINYS